MRSERIVETSGATHSKINILGVGISAIDQQFALEQIDSWISNGAREYVAVCNVFTVMECQRDVDMRQAINKASMATPDGMPLVWLASRESDRHVERVYGPDLMLAVCERSARFGQSHFFYGGAEGVPQLLAEELQGRFPGLRVAGAYSPPFRALTSEEEVDVIRMINEANPDIIWVGLGTPKQDLWIAKHRPNLRAPVMIAVGAAFDFFTNRVSQAPAWMQRNGLEWLYRLIQEPRRLWYRYLICNPWFILKIILQKTGLRTYPL